MVPQTDDEFVREWDWLAVVVARKHRDYLRPDDLDDMAAELRVELWLKRNEHDPARGSSAKTFFFKVLRNRSFCVLKSILRDGFSNVGAGKLRRQVLPQVERNNPDVEAFEAREFVHTHLNDLPERVRDVLTRRHGVGRSAQTAGEIMAELGLSKSGYHWREVAGHEALRELLEGAR